MLFPFQEVNSKLPDWTSKVNNGGSILSGLNRELLKKDGVSLGSGQNKSGVSGGSGQKKKNEWGV